MCKETFNKLWEKIDSPEFHMVYNGGGVPITGPMQLLIAVWWLGKGEVLLSVSEKFNVALSSVHAITSSMLEKILRLMNDYIVWPNRPEEFDALVEGFRNRCGFPGVIGAVDGTNIKFKAPLEDQDSYIDKNDNHSLKLQVICSQNKIFTNIVLGFPGSVHDARVFRNSQLYADVTLNGHFPQYFPSEDYHLVGDKAYPLSNWIMKPYIGDYRHLTRRQRSFNHSLSRTRFVVEHSIGLLKGRWLILKYINVNSVEKATRIIAVCCILHNFCYLNGDTWEDADNLNDHPEDENENGGVDNHLGLIKRDIISEMF